MRLECATDIITHFENIQIQIEALSENVSEDEILYRDNFEKLYYSSISKAKQLLELCTVKKPESSESESSKNESKCELNNDNLGIKLPTIQLPKFNGSFETWLDFHDCFEIMIVKNENIGDIQKFHYLKSCISGPAEKVHCRYHRQIFKLRGSFFARDLTISLY